MKKLLSVVIIGIVVLGGLGAVVTATNRYQKNSQRNYTTNSPYVDELDQSMTSYNGSLPVGHTNFLGFYTNLSIEQSFIPQKELLTRAQFLMGRNATTSSPCVLAIRDNLTGENLAIVFVTPNEFPVVNGTPTEDKLAWINFNFDDIWVTPGQTYYLVVYTTNSTDNYYWISGNDTNLYPNGSVMLSIDDGKTWIDLFPGADGCFKTYGLRETFLDITMKSGFPGPAFGIINVGNYTAWDVEVNLTIKGGILGLIDHQVVGGTQELLPGVVLNVTNGFIFGFGPVIISIHTLAANAKEISTEKNATVILFFIFIK